MAEIEFMCTSPMNSKLFDLSGKVAIVTGSDRGLGKVMDRGLASTVGRWWLHSCLIKEAEGKEESTHYRFKR